MEKVLLLQVYICLLADIVERNINIYAELVSLNVIRFI